MKVMGQWRRMNNCGLLTSLIILLYPLFPFFYVSCELGHDDLSDENIEVSVIETNIENELVRRYNSEITEIQYPNGNYSSSFILNYLQDTTELRYDRPCPVILVIYPSSNDLELQISVDFMFSDRVLKFQVPEGKDTIAIYNLIPSTIYYYRIVNNKHGHENVCALGQFKTDGGVRMLFVDGIFNVRDNGGWTCFINDKFFSVKYGYLYRGSRLNNDGVSLSEDDRRILLQENIGTDLDLRYDSEAGKIITSPLGPDVYYSRNYQTCANYCYGDVLNKDDYIRAAKLVINSIVEWGRPVYYHCAGGADRTGTFAFLIEGLLGVREVDLAKDYELTSLFPQLRSRIRTNPNYIQLVEELASINGNKTLEQEDFFLYFFHGTPGQKKDYKNPDGSQSAYIEESVLKQFIVFMTGCTMEDLTFL